MRELLSTALALIATLAPSVLTVAALLGVSGWVQRHRSRVIARQVMLTDAVHREFGAVVAPFVRKRPWGPWTAVMAVPSEHLALAGRLVGLAHQVLGADGAPEEVRVVLTRLDEPRRAPAALAPRLCASR